MQPAPWGVQLGVGVMEEAQECMIGQAGILGRNLKEERKVR